MGLRSAVASLALWLRGRLRPGSVAAEIDDEIRFHLEEEARHLVGRGWSQREARREARARFGNETLVRMECRDEQFVAVNNGKGVTMLGKDLRYGLRSLGRNPGFAAIAILTLALGIGGNTAMFTLVNSVVLRPLPYPESDRLVAIWHSYPSVGLMVASVSVPNYIDYTAETGVFEGVAAFTLANVTLTGSDAPVRLSALNTTANYFDVLRAGATAGRTFLPEEGKVGMNGIVVLSHAAWMARFGGDPAVVGSRIVLDDVSHEVVGVMPAGFISYPSADLYRPLAFTPEQLSDEARGREFLQTIARLTPGATLEGAAARMDQVAGAIVAETGNAGFEIRVGDFQTNVLGAGTGTALAVLLAAVGMVLLIGCANVASLLFARGEARQREIAVRMALGAGRATVIRQLLTESLMLGVLGGCAGFGLGTVILAVVKGLNTINLPRLAEVSLDPSVLLFTGLLALLAGLLFGAGPALRVTADAVGTSLRDGDGRMTGGRRGPRIRNALVVAEVALAVVLLISAGLMIKSFGALTMTDPGFDAGGVLSLQLSLPQNRYETDASRRAFFQETLAEIRSLPGVEYAGAVMPVPMSGANWSGSFRLEGVEYDDDAPPPNAKMRYVTDGYFASMGIPLVRGRDFTSLDDQDSPTVVIVDETFVRQYMGPGEPVGRRILRRGREPMTIVGVVGGVQDMALGELNGHIYWPHSQSPLPFMAYTVRTNGDPLALTPSVATALRRRDADLVPFDIATMSQRLRDSTANSRFSAVLIGSFAALALVLALTGIYGVVSYTVARRTNEIGLRSALGASSKAVIKLVVLQGMAPALVGVILGIGGGLAATRVLASLLYEVNPTDPLVFGAVAVVIGTVALVATVVPAARASRVSPMEALRYQ